MNKEIVHLVRLALTGHIEDVAALAKRIAQKLAKEDPEAANAIRDLLSDNHNHLRSAHTKSVPIDSDSRLELLKIDPEPTSEPFAVWSHKIHQELDTVFQERMREDELHRAGISPTRSLLFVGPPGVGKTLAAKWLAQKLERPLLTLDLAAVMSSFLGRTGSNIRSVLNFAKSQPSVLLLDEFDAIAKRRDDAGDVGELKRLVTVLLQTIDEWPTHSILIAATNHPELLDPAVWRRFDRVLEFPKPTGDEIHQIIYGLLRNEVIHSDTVRNVSLLMQGLSHADVAREINLARRYSIIHGMPFEQALFEVIEPAIKESSTKDKLAIADTLSERGLSQRQISGITGLSRDTIRKHEHTTP